MRIFIILIFLYLLSQKGDSGNKFPPCLHYFMILKYKLVVGQSSKYKTIVQSLREAREGSYYEKLDSKMEMTMTQNVCKSS
jgi:hypothetical protein